MLRRDMSSSPPLGESLPRINKFVGESFGLPNVRTIYAGAEEDRLNKDSRVILLIGAASSGKSSLIDFMCNHFYGATLEGNDRYHIANEKFDGSTPEKSIITYVFNNAYQEFRPIVIDTPGTGGHSDSDETSRLLATWLQENNRLRIDLIGVVFSCTVRMNTDEEIGLQRTLDLFPERLRGNMAVFLTGSDGSPKPDALLRRFGLQDAKAFKVNSSCLFQRKQEESLQEHLRGTYWRMTIGNFTDLYFHLRSISPGTISGAPPELPFLANTSRFSSGSSSVNTVIHREPTVTKTVTTMVGGSTISTATSMDRKTTTEEKTIVHPPRPTTGPPPPPPDLTSGNRASGLPTSLLDDIRSRKRDSGDDVVVVEYELSQPEAVILHNSPTPRDSPPRETLPSSSSDHRLPPPMTLSRPYDLPPTEFYKTVVHEASGTTTRFSSSSFSQGTKVTIGAPIGQEESPRRYANETTPPLPESTTYSTVAFMNDNGTITTDQLRTYVPSKPYDPYDQPPERAYNPYEKSPVSPEQPVIIRTPATPVTPSLSQQLRHSFHELGQLQDEDPAFMRSQSTRQPREPPQGDVVRYVYDVGSRSHRAHAVGGGRSSAHSSQRNSRDFEGRKRESRSMETITREPFYSASGFTLSRSQNKSTSSLHRLSYHENAPELIHSEDNYAIIDPKTKKVIPVRPQDIPRSPRRETLIDFPSPQPTFNRADDNRKSIRTPPGTQIPVDYHHQPQQPPQESPQQTPGAPIPKRRTSSGKTPTENRRSGVYPPPVVDARENPQYSLGGGVRLRDQPGRTGAPDQVSRELRDREDMLRQTRQDVNRESYPSPPRRLYENVHPPERYQNIPSIGDGAMPRASIGEGVQPQQQPQPVPPNRNDFMIPEQMRETKAPIQVTVGMRAKEQGRENGQLNQPYGQQNGKYAPPPQLPPHGYRDADYGDNWDGETVITTTQQQRGGMMHGREWRREEGQTQRQRPEDLRIGEGVTVNGHNDPRSPAPPPYPTRQYPTTPDARTGGYRSGGGDDSDLELGPVINQESRPLTKQQQRKGIMVTKGGGLTTTTTTTTMNHGKMQGKEKQWNEGGRPYPDNGRTITTTTTEVKRRPRVKLLNWNPCNCGTARDCLLNIICFVFAPLFLIAVIVTIIIISVTAGK